MARFIIRQPNGLLCLHSTAVDCITDYNMTEEDYIEYCKRKAEEEAIYDLGRYVKDFAFAKEAFEPRNMTEEEFRRILREMELPKEQCRHTVT